jgi:restriction endonuclease Mrr
MSLVKAKATIKPILQVLSDGKIHRDEDIQEAIAKKLRLTAEDRRILMKNGTPFYKNRTAWGLSISRTRPTFPTPSRGARRCPAAAVSGRTRLQRRV